MSLTNVARLISLQVSSRVFTFLLNTLVARRTSPQQYGKASIDLYLVYTSILFLSREPTRKVAQRLSGERGASIKLAASLICVFSFPVALLLFAGLALWWPGDSSRTGALLVGLAAVVELCGEVFYVVVALMHMRIQVRTRVEALATLVRGAIVYSALVFGGATYTTAFAASYLGYSVCFTLLLGAYYARNPAQIPHWTLANAAPNTSCLRDVERLRLCAAFGLQSVQKLALTQGEKFVLMRCEERVTEQTNGVYGLVSNLGSLVVRFLFLPIEEISSLEFSKLVAQGQALKAYALLVFLLKLNSFLGLLSFVFGSHYSDTAISLLYGSRWADSGAGDTLLHYSRYIFLLAVNGITEGFLLATIEPQRLTHYTRLLFGFSATYLALVYLLVLQGWGATGIVVANGVNMLLRIVYCSRYIADFFATDLTSLAFDCSLNRKLLAALSVCYVLLEISKAHLDVYAHIGFGTLCLALVLGVAATVQFSVGEIRALSRTKVE